MWLYGVDPETQSTGASPGVGEEQLEEVAQGGTGPLPGCQEPQNPFPPLPDHLSGLPWTPHHLNREVTFANMY